MNINLGSNIPFTGGPNPLAEKALKLAADKGGKFIGGVAKPGFWEKLIKVIVR